MAISNSIFNYITTNDTLNNVFNNNHHKKKYKLEDLIYTSIENKINGYTYRNYISIINWNTIYKFDIKLSKYNILYDIYNIAINNYLNIMNNNINTLYVDTTHINNLYGNELVDYNPSNNKHKSTKISIIIDEYNTPLNITINKSTENDAFILHKQLDDLKINHPIIFDNNKTIIGDAAYDSNKLKNKIEQFKLGNLIAPINKRNTKNINKLRQLTISDKIKLKNRHKIENIICKF